MSLNAETIEVPAMLQTWLVCESATPLKLEKLHEQNLALRLCICSVWLGKERDVA